MKLIASVVTGFVPWKVACPGIESLSGHILRSSLRSSDLLPFYHQYPAACCGDFLFVS
jgi:hypothetical protein